MDNFAYFDLVIAVGQILAFQIVQAKIRPEREQIQQFTALRPAGQFNDGLFDLGGYTAIRPGDNIAGPFREIGD